MKIKITKSEGAYTAVIPALHIVDQADTLSELKESVREAVELYVEYTLEEGSKEEVEALRKIISRELTKRDRLGISKVVSDALIRRVMPSKLAMLA